MKKNDLVLIGGFALAMAAVNAVLVWTNNLTWSPELRWKTLETMVGAALTIAVMSQLYKDNPLFKLAEHMLVGSALGYGLMLTWYNMWVNQLIPYLSDPIGQYGWRAIYQPITVANEMGKPLLLGVWSVFIPSVFGLLMYTRLSKKYAWLSRIPFALMIGFGVGIAIPAEVSANLLQQLKPMMVSIRDSQQWLGVDWKQIVILVGVMSTLVYFFFSMEHKGVVGGVSKVGIWFLMIAFGASFGYTVQGRLSLLIGRIDFLFRDWIPLIR